MGIIFSIILLFAVIHFLYIFICIILPEGKENPEIQGENYSIEHIICFHNESKFIKQKLENCYRLKHKKIHFTFINDNSTDDTLDLLQKYSKNKKNITIIDNKQNIGKNQSQIKAVNKSESDLLLFTDSNVFLEEDAISELVGSFSSSVGGLTGNVTIKTEQKKVEFSGKYWNLEKKIKRFQSLFGSVIGFDGGFYCVKRQCYNLKRENELSDLETAFLIFEQQKQVLYISNAVASELEHRNIKSSFKARIRASNRVFWSFKRIFKYANKLNYGVLFHFFCHKLSRYLFVILFVMFSPLMVIQIIKVSPLLLLVIFIPVVFRILNECFALFIGGLIALSGKEYITWSEKKAK
ncbi:MAG: glycosyltransferase [Deltaproteobacteria bacterium]|jgi:cellulose synthase/poly-beta-1,6-N-acetylglucosamine synthase-like glycosyltransferase|nr:glycosyltransferase [Deltaproteobacteria bacterium]